MREFAHFRLFLATTFGSVLRLFFAQNRLKNRSEKLVYIFYSMHATNIMIFVNLKYSCETEIKLAVVKCMAHVKIAI